MWEIFNENSSTSYINKNLDLIIIKTTFNNHNLLKVIYNGIDIVEKMFVWDIYSYAYEYGYDMQSFYNKHNSSDMCIIASEGETINFISLIYSFITENKGL